MGYSLRVAVWDGCLSLAHQWSLRGEQTSACLFVISSPHMHPSVVHGCMSMLLSEPCPLLLVERNKAS